ncbi:MAG: DNA alkylation repair protein [Prevotella sp.]|uniref:DNA alkylation repair protein n=1 Tax=Prevotella sp. TaxID=59823 RepID=UPI002A2AEB90|nr:DNA alkylation repair protein [Prevotella sp.]MDD7318891.1 DNA alkylation repair protein [Prevotellaceae bacterium]MDY4019270.1 DNA alkylation repair protein [Prevotella sp.]
MDTSDKLKQIKQSFRLRMNGETSRSMREKGLSYHINWGVSLNDLRSMAKEYGKDYDLAIALWKEDIRECKILATIIMPAEVILPEVVDIWMEQNSSPEIAEQLAFNLFQHLPYASQKAFEWISSDKELYEVCGYHVLSRLFLKYGGLSDRAEDEFLDQVQVALHDTSLAVKHAAFVCLQRYAGLGEREEKLAMPLLNHDNFD